MESAEDKTKAAAFDPLDMNNYKVEKLPKMQKSKFEVWMARLGGPLAIVEDGDEILIDVIEGRLELHVPEEEITERMKNWKLPEKNIPNGYLRLYAKVASSADKGAVILP